MPNPLQEALAATKADAVNQAVLAEHAPTQSAWFPTDVLDHLHVQVAWDGSPSDADNREDASIRWTVWTPPGQRNLAIDQAGSLRVRMLGMQRPNVFRVDRGAGRLPGTDADTTNEFCTFSLTVVLHALTP